MWRHFGERYTSLGKKLPIFKCIDSFYIGMNYNSFFSLHFLLMTNFKNIFDDEIFSVISDVNSFFMQKENGKFVAIQP